MSIKEALVTPMPTYMILNFELASKLPLQEIFQHPTPFPLLESYGKLIFQK